MRSEVGGMSISYSGLPEGLAYTLDFTEQRRGADEQRTAVRERSQLRGRDLSVVNRLPDADITIVGTSAARAHRLPRSASLVLPIRVHFVLDLDDDLETVLGRISKDERRSFRKNSRKFRWTGEMVRDIEWFDRFYDDYYRATMRNRHGARERVESKEAAYECMFRTGHLFVLSKDGEPIAGQLCHWDATTNVLTLRLPGVRDGAEEHYATGAMKAMNFLLIEWAAANGVRQIDYQGTEPFLSKGTYQAKRLTGTRVVLPPNHFGGKRLWLQVRQDRPAVRDFLVANPFLTESGGQLDAVYFYDGERPARLDYPSHSPGVREARQINLDEFLAPVSRERLRSTVA
ncbi:GNAT family N-acetyltransferase [Actinoplanes siamensis]|uniref:GNAT family N-acetyltransferase n=1 Tax=Actinoplanes siamensis TaxID=1223317 RepID=UPI0019425AF7|nr:GNAT family N-acetyltransferase [Actinoplanes siamensis]